MWHRWGQNQFQELIRGAVTVLISCWTGRKPAGGLDPVMIGSVSRARGQDFMIWVS